MVNPVLSQPVPADLFIEAARKISEVGHAPDQGALLGLAEELIGEDPAQAVSIVLRIKALTRLIDHPLMRAWSTDSGLDPNEAYLSEPVLRAAADFALTGDDQNPGFDPDAFFEHVLAVSEGKGRG